MPVGEEVTGGEGVNANRGRERVGRKGRKRGLANICK